MRLALRRVLLLRAVDRLLSDGVAVVTAPRRHYTRHPAVRVTALRRQTPLLPRP